MSTVAPSSLDARAALARALHASRQACATRPTRSSKEGNVRLNGSTRTRARVVSSLPLLSLKQSDPRTTPRCRTPLMEIPLEHRRARACSPPPSPCPCSPASASSRNLERDVHLLKEVDLRNKTIKNVSRAAAHCSATWACRRATRLEARRRARAMRRARAGGNAASAATRSRGWTAAGTLGEWYVRVRENKAKIGSARRRDAPTTTQRRGKRRTVRYAFRLFFQGFRRPSSVTPRRRRTPPRRRRATSMARASARHATCTASRRSRARARFS